MRPAPTAHNHVMVRLVRTIRHRTGGNQVAPRFKERRKTAPRAHSPQPTAHNPVMVRLVRTIRHRTGGRRIADGTRSTDEQSLAKPMT